MRCCSTRWIYRDIQLKRIEQELAIAAQQRGVALLQSIPGVGPRTAESDRRR
ncbi:MAG: hypothetical protein H6816_11535 [Phycisphaerales bacterium]|nr:hypothetical protein [Phycisphaerales bacterium]